MKPRRRQRRRRPHVCQRCGGLFRLVGQPGLGVQLFKCPACGIMDRRLPSERRVIPSELVGGPVRRFWTRPVVVALELLALVAIAAAAAIALLP